MIILRNILFFYLEVLWVFITVRNSTTFSNKLVITIINNTFHHRFYLLLQIVTELSALHFLFSLITKISNIVLYSNFATVSFFLSSFRLLGKICTNNSNYSNSSGENIIRISFLEFSVEHFEV